MKEYEIFEHTADIGIIAHGLTLEKAFENVAKGMFSIITNKGKIERKEKKIIEISREGDNEQLVVDFLSELLYIHDVENYVFGEFNVKINNVLTAEAWGEKYNREKHGYGIEIKAVTYHLLAIKEDEKGFHITVLFDI
ncbi:MAG: archease [Thermoplasmata archaeon]|nr:MAG: archease [Thermoplasmata archaeon]